MDELDESDKVLWSEYDVGGAYRPCTRTVLVTPQIMPDPSQLTQLTQLTQLEAGRRKDDQSL